MLASSLSSLPMTNCPPLRAREALSALSSRSLSATELTEATIERIRDSTLGAVELLDEQGARDQARDADLARARGQGGPLAGLPILVKDVIDVSGLPTRGGTAAWRRLPERDAACVAALRGAGAVVIGKAHTNELAFGIDGRNPHRPPCLNPHDHDVLPGGSSSGPAVAVAARLVLGALGTDTSGSIRVPCALCGVAGLRPTRGLLSLRGVLPLAPAYDVVGPIAACVDDLGLLFGALLDGESRAGSGEAGAPTPSPNGEGQDHEEIRRVVLIENLLEPAVCDPGVARLVRGAAEVMARMGLEVDSVSIPSFEQALVVHRDVQLPEAAQSVRALGVPETELGTEVRERVRRADEIPAEHHMRALRERQRIAGAIHRVLPPAGVLLAPGCLVGAPARDARELRIGVGPVRSVRDVLLSCTVPLTQSDGPVLAVPVGCLESLPVGVQLLARPGWDRSLLELGRRLELALDT